MKKRIRISESQLSAIVRDAVNEMFRDGENYPLANATVDKMLGKGQFNRAHELMKAYKSMNDTDDVEYDYDIVTVKSPDGKKRARYNDETDCLIPIDNEEDDTDISFTRRLDRKNARHIADRIKKVNPNTTYDKNDFIYESVREKIKKMLG